eukprot:CAMPEP_0175964396 /NCGR_PEP_ID=MMETSP0108-20121206/37534_1 /TAXON_ID=195067 ORGANISM="Goniomonas pacifica, Strain CCMP1869" /NCGR_SAMPLE_ID=MMETSP0108 /ASSEMBLY_ACC=CAM_ASM_000204 /LENGTH=253 /DNA_ID=CAMNT_0017292365 /DNA_START=98 /DNA_END=859 /DNA_ORIENTATION=+
MAAPEPQPTTLDAVAAEATDPKVVDDKPQAVVAEADKQVAKTGDDDGERKRRRTPRPWSEQEHNLFLMGLRQFGRGDWRSISRYFVKSRTPVQIASHAQKFFIRLQNTQKRQSRGAPGEAWTGPYPVNFAPVAYPQVTGVPGVPGVPGVQGVGVPGLPQNFQQHAQPIYTQQPMVGQDGTAAAPVPGQAPVQQQPRDFMPMTVQPFSHTALTDPATQPGTVAAQPAQAAPAVATEAATAWQPTSTPVGQTHWQ